MIPNSAHYYMFHVFKYTQNILKHDGTEEITCSYECSCNYGKNMHHGLGPTAIANGKFSNSKFIRQAISHGKMQTWPDNSPDVPALTRTI